MASLCRYDEGGNCLWDRKCAEDAQDPWLVEAMNEEMQTLDWNETLDLLLHSPHRKAIGCRWIYKAKYNTNSIVNRYKARVVIKGFTQSRSQRDLCPIVKDENNLYCNRACNSKRMASPSNGCQERLPSRWIRWGSKHGTTTRLQVELASNYLFPTQKAYVLALSRHLEYDTRI
mgnify:FL=1